MNYPQANNSSPYPKRSYSKPQLTAQRLWHPVMQGSLPIGISGKGIDWSLDWWRIPLEPKDQDF